MALELERIPFGYSIITVEDKDGEKVTFDGVDEFQADSGTWSISAMLADIVIRQLGENVYDKRVTGHEGSVEIQGAQRSLRVLNLAIAAAEPIIDSGTSEITGMADMAIGSSLREKAKKVTIHPGHLPLEDKTQDVTFYKMIADGEYSESSGNEQSNVPINLTMLPRDNMNPNGPGNFYYIGATDPNAVVTP